MSEAAAINGGRLRVRVASFAMSTALVVLTCVVLVAVSRVTAYFEQAPATGVEFQIEERETSRPPPRTRLPPPVRTTDAAAPPTPTQLPVDRAVLARALSCFSRHERERPADCPREAPPSEFATPELPQGGDFAPPERVDLGRIYTRAEQSTLVTPSCIRDGASGACIRFGTKPPPPSRSAQEVCEDGGIGPCQPPEFRPEDVVRQRHTQQVPQQKPQLPPSRGSGEAPKVRARFSGGYPHEIT